ncbi:hypothetical protein PanWU01x14_202110 [Parasponia andersonii]|uniref:Protein preY, mitochondrial n=1 Tax=Parasponia andersonii TaxID=3476 RepID=A0A2P5BXI9_PARAD|nr:hypothetical protein PanWU01x14_202110 [Parasponia andersonii]
MQILYPHQDPVPNEPLLPKQILVPGNKRSPGLNRIEYWSGRNKTEMVRITRKLLQEAGSGLNKILSEILVCPLSKQPLRFCEKTNSLISEAIGVSFPIKDGIPCLVPKDGKILESEDTPNESYNGGIS